MTLYKIGDEFLDQVDELLDAVMDAAEFSDTLDNAGVTLVDMQKFERAKTLSVRLHNTMSDGFDTIKCEK